MTFLTALGSKKAFAYFILLIACLMHFTACGKRRPPVPPVSRPALNQSQLTAVQRGNEILLQIPLINTSKFTQADIYRLAEAGGAPLFLTEDEFASRSTLIGSAEINAANNGIRLVTYVDKITAAGQANRLRYAVRLVNREGQKTAFSNFLLIEPALNIAQAPVLSPPEITSRSLNLNWQTPAANVDGSSPANILGYNVYRSSAGTLSDKPINASLLTENSFEDTNFDFGNEYTYFVRSVSSGTNGTQVESSDSNRQTITPRDVFPPSAPEGLTIAAAPGRLSLFFAANQENDVIGYNVYRTTDNSLPREKWQRLNASLINTTTYQDLQVESGQRYFYFVTALDSAKNESAASEIVFETAP